MPFFVIAAALALAAEPKVEAPIRVVARPWAPFISPMGEPFRSEAAGDDPLARWFHQADRNRDGMLTAGEMAEDAARFYATLDSNHDGEIDPEEIAAYETDIAPEVQVNSQWKRNREEPRVVPSAGSGDHGDKKRRRDHEEIDGYQLYGLQGAARYSLLNLPEPVAGADEDFNRGITLAEFQRAAAHRFQLLDGKSAGYLSLADLEGRLPSRPRAGKRVDLPKDIKDTRVGQPFPRN